MHQNLREDEDASACFVYWKRLIFRVNTPIAVLLLLSVDQGGTVLIIVCLHTLHPLLARDYKPQGRSARFACTKGAVYKGRPPKSRIFKPPPSPCPGVSEFPKPPPSPDVRVRIFQFYTFVNFYTFLFLLIKTNFIAQFLFL